MTDAVKMAIEALRTLIPEVPRLGERDDYADDFLLSVKVTSGELRAARKALAALEQAGEPVAAVLPCDVKLPPATTIRAGCNMDTLLLAMSVPDRPKHFEDRKPLAAPLPTLQRLGQEFDAGETVHPDTARLDALRDECWDLRCFSVPTGGDDADVAWKVVGHWMAEPQERTIAEGWSHDPRVAIDAALSSAKRGDDEG